VDKGHGVRDGRTRPPPHPTPPPVPGRTRPRRPPPAAPDPAVRPRPYPPPGFRAAHSGRREGALCPSQGPSVRSESSWAAVRLPTTTHRPGADM